MPGRYDREGDWLFNKLSFISHVCANSCLPGFLNSEFALARNSQAVTFIFPTIRLLSGKYEM